MTSSATRVGGPRPGRRGASAGELLRGWRQLRRRSQLDLALETGVSARHLSFVETGRAAASPGLLLALAEQLDVPLRERNALMLAAGYAPAFSEVDLDGEEARPARDSLAQLLAGHEPCPAVVLDRWGDVVLANRSVGLLLHGVAPALVRAPLNVHRLGLHPDGLASRVRDREAWVAHLGHRLARLTRLTGDPRLADLLAEVRGHPGVAAALDQRHEPASRELLMTVHLDSAAGELRFHTTVTSFGSPRDVTLSELAVESFFPADQATRDVLHRQTVDAGTGATHAG